MASKMPYRAKAAITCVEKIPPSSSKALTWGGVMPVLLIALLFYVVVRQI
jgi:hypothetical protein